MQTSKLSIKYWVGHNKKSEDVFTNTLYKNKSDSLFAMEKIFGEDWFMDEDFEVILIEIKEVVLK